MLRIAVNGELVFSKEQIDAYRETGVVYLESFYDLEKEILPIKRDIHWLIGTLIKQHNLSIKQESFSANTFDSGLNEMIKDHRNVVGILYDAIKKSPSYIRLASSYKHDQLAQSLLGTDYFGFANRGYGMRMDNPNEDIFLTQWHQDYVSQLCSPKGIVLWSPLRDVTAEVGPVRICPGSHKEGIFPIIKDAEGSYGLKIKNEKSILEKFTEVVPEVKVGDLVVIDYLTLHASSPNRSKSTRWAMISRYFDFSDPVGIKNGWKGGLQEGNSFETIHPELSEIALPA